MISSFGEDISLLYGLAFFPKPWDQVQQCVRQAEIDPSFPLLSCMATSTLSWYQLDMQAFKYARLSLKLSLYQFLDSSKVSGRRLQLFFHHCCGFFLHSAGLCLRYRGGGGINCYLPAAGVHCVPCVRPVRHWTGGGLSGAQRECSSLF